MFHRCTEKCLGEQTVHMKRFGMNVPHPVQKSMEFEPFRQFYRSLELLPNSKKVNPRGEDKEVITRVG